MKKIVSLLVALLLCLSSVAFAKSVPSKTTGDMTKIEVEAENMPADSGFFIQPVAADDEAYQRQVEICQNKINELMQAESVKEFFGEVKTASGEVVDIAALLGSEDLNVNEFVPLVVGEYKEEYGVLKLKMQFSTPYAVGEQVIALIGLVTIDQNGAENVEWVAYEAVGVAAENAGVEAQGCLQLELDPEIILAIQEGTAMLAIVSK